MKQMGKGRPQQGKKTGIWTKEKVSQLIRLYREHECLWNHHTEAYKCKDRRQRAIEAICTDLRVAKFEISKKIHNLRNQFNSEMKKLERRLEVARGSDAEFPGGHRCRWDHFDDLMFLHNIIEPRPGGCHSVHSPPKKLRLKYDYALEDSSVPPAEEASTTTTPFHYQEVAETTDAVDFHGSEASEEEIGSQRVNGFDQKYNPPTTAMSAQVPTAMPYFTRAPQPPPQIKSNQTEIIHIEAPPSHVGGFLEVPASTASRGEQISTQVCPSSVRCASFKSSRDQWSSFGELIANEFRNLNSDASRKKLMRKIMHAMLEIGEEDDALS